MRIFIMSTEVLFFNKEGQVHRLYKEKQSIPESRIKLTARELGLFSTFIAQVTKDDKYVTVTAYRWNKLLTRYDLMQVKEYYKENGQLIQAKAKRN